MRDKVTRQCPQTTIFEEKRAEADSNRGPSAYQPNALPPGQTGSLGLCRTMSTCVIYYYAHQAQLCGSLTPAAVGQWRPDLSGPKNHHRGPTFPLPTPFPLQSTPRCSSASPKRGPARVRGPVLKTALAKVTRRLPKDTASETDKGWLGFGWTSARNTASLSTYSLNHG